MQHLSKSLSHSLKITHITNKSLLVYHLCVMCTMYWTWQQLPEFACTYSLSIVSAARHGDPDSRGGWFMCISLSLSDFNYKNSCLTKSKNCVIYSQSHALGEDHVIMIAMSYSSSVDNLIRSCWWKSPSPILRPSRFLQWISAASEAARLRPK